MIDAICDGFLPLLQGQDLDATKAELTNQFSNALATYRKWTPPPTAGSGAALFAKMAPTFASACLDIEGSRTATL
jgi:hypothetical protein